jgi:tryptophanase
MNEYDFYLEDVYLDIYEDFGSSAVSDPAYADFLQHSANDEAYSPSPARLDESYLLPPF